jgi:hypothetical protein
MERSETRASSAPYGSCDTLRQLILNALTEWDSFYVIVGAAAGGLIGLQFVVMTLIAERPPLRAAEAGAAFATPTIVHFSAVLLLSALLRAPWHAYTSVQLFCAIIGVCGSGYIVVVARRMRAQRAYTPELEDLAFHAILPVVAYATLVAAAVMVSTNFRESLFAVAASALLLLFTGIHNAWDAIAYHVLIGNDRDEPAK